MQKTATLPLMALLTLLASTAAGQDYASTAEQVRPLLIGAQVPDLMLDTVDQASVSLRDSILENSAVIVFYRGGWCPYGNLQLGRLRDIEPRLHDMGYQIVAISPDSPAKLAESKGKLGMIYELFSDSKMESARAFGVAYKVDDKTRELYKEKGIDLEAASGEGHQLLPVPSVFLVAPNGEIVFSYVNPDYKDLIDTDLLLAAAKAHEATPRH